MQSPLKGQESDSDEVMQLQENNVFAVKIKGKGIILDEKATQLMMSTPDIKKQMKSAYLFINSKVVRDTQSI